MALRIKKTSQKPKIGSLIELFRLLNDVRPRNGYVNLYRGHAHTVDVFRPSLFREKGYRKAERNILRELIARQPSEFRSDKTAFEQLVRMQHYGLPTRLLDLTYNPLVALYFACGGDNGTSAEEGEFVRFTMPAAQIKYFDSDTVSCLANLSNLTGRERDAIRSMTEDVALKDSDVGLRLLHFIKAEKPYFLPKIKLDHLKSVLAVRPKQTNQRILAQQGAFLLFGLKTRLSDANDFGIQISRTCVPAAKKADLLKELDGININGSTLFPEISSAAKYIMSKIPISEEDYESYI